MSPGGPPTRYTRIYTDERGESRFEKVDIELCRADFAPPASPLDLSAPYDAARVIFAAFPTGWVGERHNPPRRRFFPRVVGDVPATGAFVQLSA